MCICNSGYIGNPNDDGRSCQRKILIVNLYLDGKVAVIISAEGNGCFFHNQFHCPMTTLCLAHGALCNRKDDCGTNFDESDLLCDGMLKIYIPRIL